VRSEITCVYLTNCASVASSCRRPHKLSFHGEIQARCGRTGAQRLFGPCIVGRLGGSREKLVGDLYADSNLLKQGVDVPHLRPLWPLPKVMIPALFEVQAASQLTKSF